MSYLLDTCVISELIKPKPPSAVITWIQNCFEFDLYLSVLTLGEIQKGIEKLPTSKKKTQLKQWLEIDLRHRFESRILPIDIKTVNVWGSILAQAEKQGRPLAAIDSLLAATAKAHELVLVTRNLPDFEGAQIPLFNPWPD